MTRPHPHIAAMAAYALADLAAPPGVPLLSLSQNESLRPPSPAALAAAAEALGQGALYPDPDWTDLRRAIAAVHGIDPGGILCGAGSLDLIGCLMRAYAGPGRAVLAPAHAYPFFATAAAMAGARCDTAPEAGGVVRVAALLEAQRADTAVVCVANPGNPTGTGIPNAEIRALRAGLRDDVLLIVDEAYGEFADHLEPPPFDMVEAGNTVVLRTLSKAYGLAGFRVGWGLFPAAIGAEVRKVMNPNNISAVAQAAAAAAIRDQAYMRATCAQTAQAREAAVARLERIGLACQPGFTNFVLIDMGTAARAARADAYLRARGIFLRAQGGAGLPHALRMTLAGPADMGRALEALAAWQEENGP